MESKQKVEVTTEDIFIQMILDNLETIEEKIKQKEIQGDEYGRGYLNGKQSTYIEMLTNYSIITSRPNYHKVQTAKENYLKSLEEENND